MGDWWIDETPYPGPHHQPTVGELLQGLRDSGRRIGETQIQFGGHLHTATLTLLAAMREGKLVVRQGNFSANTHMSGATHDFHWSDEFQDWSLTRFDAAAQTAAEAAKRISDKLSDHPPLPTVNGRVVPIKHNNTGPRSGKKFGRRGQAKY